MPCWAIVRHRVADFDAWKVVYDSVADVQAQGGVHDHAVLRDPGDPASVTVIHTFASREQAGAFLDDDALKQAMGRGGVDPASVQVEILDEVSSGRHA